MPSLCHQISPYLQKRSIAFSHTSGIQQQCLAILGTSDCPTVAMQGIATVSYGCGSNSLAFATGCQYGVATMWCLSSDVFFPWLHQNDATVSPHWCRDAPNRSKWYCLAQKNMSDCGYARHCHSHLFRLIHLSSALLPRLNSGAVTLLWRYKRFATLSCFLNLVMP